MLPEEFIHSYASALATQDWTVVEPLFADHVSVTFSDGSVHLGKGKVQLAFERNFTKIKSEKYAIDNVVWLKKEASYAVYLFEFSWTGIVNEQLVSGSGIGTSVLTNEDGTWKLLTEHLGRRSN